MSRLSDDYTPSTGSGTSSPLPTAVDTSVGQTGMFGVSYGDQAFANGTLTAASAYTLDTADPVTTAVDNAYMAWDPDVDATLLTVKQPGVYLVRFYLGTDDVMPDSGALFVARAGPNIPALPGAVVPAGPVAANQGIAVTSTVFLPADAVVALGTDHTAVTDPPNVGYAGLFFLPLFELSPT